MPLLTASMSQGRRGPGSGEVGALLWKTSKAPGFESLGSNNYSQQNLGQIIKKIIIIQIKTVLASFLLKQAVATDWED